MPERVIDSMSLSHLPSAPRPRPVPLAWSPRGLFRASVCVAVCSALLVPSGCDDSDTTTGGAGGSGHGGSGGNAGAGGCLVVPQPTFELRVLVQKGGPLPPDTTVEASWSAGDEPPFHLDEPESWSTLETSNMTCDVDPNAPPPTDLQVLTCALWTASPTFVRVSAKGYVTQEDTYAAEAGDECKPEATPIEIELAPVHE